MRHRDVAEAGRIDGALRSYHETTRPLPGIQAPAHRAAFLEQVMESIHRVRYVARVLQRNISVHRADPASDLFDPIKAAALHARHGRHDEALLARLPLRALWEEPAVRVAVRPRHLRRLGGTDRWDWDRVSGEPAGFRAWLAANQNTLKSDGIVRRFGNHRKYQSLEDHKPNGTGAAVQSYVAWVDPARTHDELFRDALAAASGDGRQAFATLYRSMTAVVSFGRTAKFDYLTMIGKLGLAPIEPDSTYMIGATGPLDGARLLFLGSPAAEGVTSRQLDGWLVELERNCA